MANPLIIDIKDERLGTTLLFSDGEERWNLGLEWKS